MSMPYATAYELNILEKQLTEKIKEAAINGIDTNPTKLSELQNDVGYIPYHQTGKIIFPVSSIIS